MKILLVEDNPITSRLMATYFKAQGHEVMEAEDGIIGLEYVQDYSPDVIFLDYWLPGISGVEFLKALRSRLDPTPVILATAVGSEELERVRGMISSLGPVRLVRKPISVEELDGLLGSVGGR